MENCDIIRWMKSLFIYIIIQSAATDKPTF